MGIATGDHIDHYEMNGLTRLQWPGPQLDTATTTDGQAAENETCLYSGDPITHTLELDGRRFGFCNSFCRDKTLADPLAWPNFVKVYEN